MKNLLLCIRDLGCFALLLCLVNMVFQRTVRFVNAHEHSLTHELDSVLLRQIHEIKDQLLKTHKTLILHKNEPFLEELQQIIGHVEELEEEYKTNSDSYIFLGPLGTATIVFKERRIKRELRKVMSQFATLLTKKSRTVTASNTLHSIEDWIAHTGTLLVQLQGSR